MKLLPLVLLSAVLSFAGNALHAANAAQAHVRALLVLASNQRGESDPRLAPFEPNLRRILRFESYRLAGEGQATVAAPGSANVAMGRGHTLSIDADKSDGRGLHLRVNWQADGHSLMNTGLSLRPGTPAVLGGPSSGKEGEVWAVIVIAE